MGCWGRIMHAMWYNGLCQLPRTWIMEFKVIEHIKHPTEAVYLTYRDRLDDLVPYLPNVDHIDTMEREDNEQGPRLLNKWNVSGALPRTVRPFFKESTLSYLDHAQWNDAENLVNWRLEIGVFPEAVSCGGVNYFRPGSQPDTTDVVLTGDLSVDLARVKGVPRLLRRLAPTVERFVLERIKPNLSSVTHAVARFLDEQ